DTLISYRRNPHTDMAERGAEAADILFDLLQGMRVTVAHVRMPVCAPPTQLLTAPGTGPYADMIEAAEALDDSRIVNVSVVGGFAYGDTPKHGMTVIASTCDNEELARQIALDLVGPAWQKRAAFTPELTSLAEAVKLAKAAGDDPALPAVLLAD